MASRTPRLRKKATAVAQFITGKDGARLSRTRHRRLTFMRVSPGIFGVERQPTGAVPCPLRRLWGGKNTNQEVFNGSARFSCRIRTRETAASVGSDGRWTKRGAGRPRAALARAGQ